MKSVEELNDAESSRILEAGFLRMRSTDTYHLTVLTATGCNLGCGYCFQNTSTNPDNAYAPDRIPSERLTRDDIDAVAEFLDQSVHRARASRIGLVLFGGEPLLSFDSCLAMLRSAGAVAPTQGLMVTNGALLTARRASALEEHGLAAIQVTLDGDRARHDATRYTRSGRGTYDVICRNLSAVQATTRIALNVRINIIPSDPSSYVRLIDDLARRVEPGRTSVDLSLVRDYAWNDGDAQADLNSEFFTALTAIANRVKSLGFLLARPSSRDCPFCSEQGGHDGAVVGPGGVLYSSWQTAGRSEYAVGDVRTGYSAGLVESRWSTCREFDSANSTAGSGPTSLDYFDGVIMDLAQGASAPTGAFH